MKTCFLSKGSFFCDNRPGNGCVQTTKSEDNGIPFVRTEEAIGGQEFLPLLQDSRSHPAKLDRSTRGQQSTVNRNHTTERKPAQRGREGREWGK